MNLVSKKDFAESCGLDSNKIWTYAKRGKIVLEGDLIDADNSINVAFRTKRLNSPKKTMKSLVKSSDPKENPYPLSETQPKNPENEAFSRQNTSPQEVQTERMLKKMDIDYEKKQKEIERLDQEMRLAKLQEEKLLGKLIPTDMVKNLFAQHFKSVTLSFKQAADLIAVEFGKKAKIARNDQAELRGQLVTIINRAIEDGITESKRTLSHIVHEYSQTRK